MTSLGFESASGLRPASAFILVGIVLTLVALKAAKIALADEGEQPRNLTQDPAPSVTFDLLDRNGTPLALSVERLELEMSPNAMWQAHTPDKIATALSEVLGAPYTPEELLARMLPDAQNGVIRVETEPFLMDEVQARAVYRWSRTGSTDEGAEHRPILGIWIHPTDRAGEYALDWMPTRVLSVETRRAHGEDRALDWTRTIADDLFVCLYGSEALEDLDDDEQRTSARRRIWNALLPCQYKSVVKEVSPEAAIALYDLLKEERVREHQMRLVRNAKRVYPVQGDVRADVPVAVLGRWGTLEPEQARKRAREELRLAGDEHLTDRERDELLSMTRVKVYQPSPMSGLELLCERLLRQPEWSFLERRREEYTFLANQVPRQPLQRYFQELVPASETPHVVTAIDLPLQRHLRLCLEQLIGEHQPAAALAIALEVATGKVLAVDAIDPYDVGDAGGFLPTMHTFTPGSTMKVIVMASALDAGVVRLDEKINTFDGGYHVGSRHITEAEGAKTGWLTPAEGVAHSCNAVLVQIGLRIPPAFFHRRLFELGYGQYPHVGLGGERNGWLTPLADWKKPQFTQASVSFGYETSVTLWQHAAALATVVRGGEYRPLELLDAVEQHGVSHPVSLAPPRRVFTPATCATVREMMQLGARVGTGRRVHCADIVMGTKTGTAQKVGSELCLHVELEHNQKHGCRGARACRRSLVGRKAHRGSCYTASMCAFGHLPGSEHEVLVLVVVDEPRGGKKYGADVAGRAAVSILQEALGHTRGGVVATAGDAPGASAPSVRTANAPFVSEATRSGHGASVAVRLPLSADQPWAEDEHAAR